MSLSSMLQGMASMVTERNCLIILAVIFVAVSGAVMLAPYDPMDDLADATTNAIWVQQYSRGTYHIPYEDWTYGQTQSVVVLHDGEYVVVNEKGPGHAFLLLPFYMAGADALFGPAMLLLGLTGTYMLGKRLAGWQVGFIASLLLVSNLVVIVMCHRSYWTDASTMHLAVFSLWLMVEARERPAPTDGEGTGIRRLLPWGLMLLSGLFFGLAVSTRYPTALLVILFPAYILGGHLPDIWRHLRKPDLKAALRLAAPRLMLLAVFGLGLLLVLVPLFQYNTAYFGGPLNSGYDATSLAEFMRTGELDSRNTTSAWTGGVLSYISTALGNLAALLPVFVARMPALIFAPLGMYYIRRRRVDLALLLLWVGINWFTYLSLEWVRMYTHPHLVPWEPRYWMPSLPPLCILGALGMYKLAGRADARWGAENRWAGHERKAARVLVVGALAGAIMLWGLVPAAGYLQEPNARMMLPGGGPRQVSTDQLLQEPAAYLDSPVLVTNASIVWVTPYGIGIRSDNATLQGGVEVRFIDWPPGALPGFAVGGHVEVEGMFLQDRPMPGQAASYFIGVKYDTRDMVRLLP